MPQTKSYYFDSTFKESSDFLVVEHSAKSDIDLLIEDLVIAHKSSLKVSLKQEWSLFNDQLHNDMFNKIS